MSSANPKNPTKSSSPHESNTSNKHTNPNTEARRLFEKKPCPLWSECRRQSDENHKTEYYHPCMKGEDCTRTNNQYHLNNFLHKCPHGKNCKDTNNKLHCLYFLHSMNQNPIAVMKTLESLPICRNIKNCQLIKNKDHCESYRHFCSFGLKCSKTSDPLHKRLYIHPCKYQEQCKNSCDAKHCFNFIHPCRYGASCRMLQRGEINHMILYSHDSPIAVDIAKFNWPTSWKNPSPPNPSTLDTKKLQPHFKLVTLSPSNQEYQSVYSLFKSKLQNQVHTLVSIERLENYVLWKWYMLKEREIKTKNNGNANEMQLFHGTPSNIASTICNEGFDFRVASFSGMFGAGVYFSPESSYSYGYTNPDSSGVAKMFVARVLVGNPYTCSSDSSLRRPPQIPGSTELYDSVHGTCGHRIIYDNTQAYPEYLISFKKQ